MNSRGEFDLIERIRQGQKDPAPGVLCSIGDDAAVVEPGPWVVTTDVMVEQIHFRLDWATPDLIGRRALRANLSDLAAMGARPHSCLLTLVLGTRHTTDWFESFLTGLEEDCRDFEIPLIGGDLSRGDRVTVSITALGQPAGQQPLYRSGGKAGDRLLLFGPVGFARLGWTHLKNRTREKFDQNRLEQLEDPLLRQALEAYLLPRPRVGEGVWLGENQCANALIDISDGLAADLMHLLQSSGCRAVLEAESLRPVSPRHESWLSLALEGGEDFCLLAAVSEEQKRRISETLPSSLERPQEIGRLEEGAPSIELIEGRSREYQPKGFDHFR